MDISRLKIVKAWVPLTEGVRILCRYLTAKELDAIKVQANVSELVAGGQRIERRDEEKFRQLLGRAVVKDWEGLEDDGKTYPCTPENVDFLMEEYAEFRMLVISVPLSFERMLALEKAQAEKNSPATSAPE